MQHICCQSHQYSLQSRASACITSDSPLSYVSIHKKIELFIVKITQPKKLLNNMLVYILLAILIALLLCDYLFKYKTRSGRLLNSIPGPSPLPIIGNLLLFRDKSPKAMWATTRKLSELYYPILKGWALHQAFVSVRHPDDLEAILTHPKATCKDFPYKFLRSWLDNGIFTNRGYTHKNRRRMLTPAFHFNMLKGYMNIINEQSDQFMTELKNRGEEFVVDVIPLYADLSLSIIAECAMGVKIDKSGKKIIQQYKEDIEEMGNIFVYRMTRPYIADWMLPFFEIGRIQRKTIKRLHDLTDKIIQDRREYHRINNTNFQGYKEFTENLEKDSETMYSMGHKKNLRMLDILLAAEKDGLINAAGVREEVDTFLFGGTDTTRMAMAYFTMHMAENKEAQDRARAEVCLIVEESGGRIGAAELEQMPYLKQCIKETLRLHPIAGTVLRNTIDYLKLKNYTIPPNVTIICNIIDVHRDPNFWEEPLKFDPDRFTPERSSNRHPFAYIPFCVGPRNCIGQKFGWLEMKAACSRLLYNFYLEPVDRTCDMKLIGGITLRPENPFHTKFIKIYRE